MKFSKKFWYQEKGVPHRKQRGKGFGDGAQCWGYCLAHTRYQVPFQVQVHAHSERDGNRKRTNTLVLAVSTIGLLKK